MSSVILSPDLSGRRISAVVFCAQHPATNCRDASRSLPWSRRSGRTGSAWQHSGSASGAEPVLRFLIGDGDPLQVFLCWG